MVIEEIAEGLKQFNVTFLSSISPGPGDVDLAVSPQEIEAVNRYLLDSGFTLFDSNPYQRKYCGFFQGRGYEFDVVSDFNLYTRYSVGLELSSAGKCNLVRSPSLYKALKYVCQRRVEKLDFVVQQHAELRNFLRDERNIKWISDPFYAALSGPTVELFDAIHRHFSFRKFLPRFVRNRLITPLSEMYRRRQRGATIAMIGPDGSGKSFIIDKLKQIDIHDVQYMGDWFFTFQKFYNLVMRIPSPFNRFVYLFYLIENFARQVKVYGLKLRGRVVLLDRFPGTNRNAAHKGVLGKINHFVYTIFPKPDLTILLYARPEVIYARKQELTVAEIATLQNALREKIENSPHAIIDTENLDGALNEITRRIAGATKDRNAHYQSSIGAGARLLMKIRARTLLGLATASYCLSKACFVPSGGKGKTRVLVFHHLDEPRKFARVVAGVKKRYNIISLQDYRDGKVSKEKINVIFAFDDGYKSWHANGLPVFQRYGVKPLLFVNSDFVGLSEAHAFDYCSSRINTWPEASLSWGELSELVAAGAEVGGHGSGHKDMSADLSMAELKSFVVTDRQVIHDKLGVQPRTFTYPFGRFHELATQAVQASGYQLAFCSTSGFLEESACEFTLKRSNVGMRSPLTVYAVIEGYSDSVSKAVRRVKSWMGA